MSQFMDDIAELWPDTLTADGMDDAILGGFYDLSTSTYRLVYSRPKVVEILQTRDGMTYDEAFEFAEFNIFGAWVGPGTPIFMEPVGYDE